jgi:hypothetical protein
MSVIGHRPPDACHTAEAGEIGHGCFMHSGHRESAGGYYPPGYFSRFRILKRTPVAREAGALDNLPQSNVDYEVRQPGQPTILVKATLSQQREAGESEPVVHEGARHVAAAFGQSADSPFKVLADIERRLGTVEAKIQAARDRGDIRGAQ